MRDTEANGRGLPFLNAYWVITGKLMAGEFPLAADPQVSSERISRLIHAGIRYIVDLTEPGEIRRLGPAVQEYHEQVEAVARAADVTVVCRSIGIRDFSAPSRTEMARILDQIDHAIENDRPVYVHCWAGIGRTGTVVGCYLARHGIASDIALLDTIRQMRRHTDYAFIDSPQSREQIDLVLSWVEGE